MLATYRNMHARYSLDMGTPWGAGDHDVISRLPTLALILRHLSLLYHVHSTATVVIFSRHHQMTSQYKVA